MDLLTIPKTLTQKGALVVVPRHEYQELLKLRKRLLWEEKDTDRALRTFDQEKKSGKLKTTTSFRALLNSAKKQ